MNKITKCYICGRQRSLNDDTIAEHKTKGGVLVHASCLRNATLGREVL